MKMKHPLPQKVDELRPDKPGELLMWPTSNSITVEHQSATLSQPESKLRVDAGILVRASATCRILFGMTAIFTIFGVIVMSRIRTLEIKNEALQAQLSTFEATLKEVYSRLPAAVPLDGNQVPTTSSEEEGFHSQETGEKRRMKRDVALSNVSMAMVNSSDETEVSSDPDDEEMMEERMNRTARKVKHRRRDKGKRGAENEVFAKRKSKNRVKALRLKLKLVHSRLRVAVAQLTKAKMASTSTSFDTRAIYMIPVAPNVDISKSKQLIGPWYIGEGADFGFNDLWYRDLSLNENRMKIAFNRSGLHLIYAQVYYHLTLGIGEKPAPMGYRIYIEKGNSNGNYVFRRPIPVAECVPSFPSTFYQTCFTQVVWYLEKGDQVFLEHFADSFPMIEADRQGKTFLGIVKLGP